MTLDGLHILVLEDEPIIAFALEDMLLDEGATVTLATSIEEATGKLETVAVDCAILDVNLHGEKSYPIAYMLRSTGALFIFATGYGDAEHPADLADVPTVTKPYAIGQIKDALDLAG